MKTESEFKSGLRDGMPIALGYLAVSFSLGIQAKAAGISAFYASLMSLLNVTSAGEFAAISIIAINGSITELALSQFIINLRYMLMSCALSQKLNKKTGTLKRMLMSFGITDEIFGISVSRNVLNPMYTFGAMAVSIPGWTIGTALGVILGNILPEVLVSALCIALYGMFIAIIIPPAKKERNVGMAVILAMLSSYIFSIVPVLRDISSGTKVIILTVSISLLFAIICPVNENTNNTESEAA